MFECDDEFLTVKALVDASNAFLIKYNKGGFKDKACGETYIALIKENAQLFNNHLSEAVYYGFNVNDKFRNGKDLYDLLAEHKIKDDFAFFEILYTIKSLGDFDFSSERLLKSKNAEMFQAFNNPIKYNKGEENEQIPTEL